MKKFALVLSAFALVASGCGNNSVTSKNATDPAVIGLEISATEKATGKAITSPPIESDKAPTTSLTRKK